MLFIILGQDHLLLEANERDDGWLMNTSTDRMGFYQDTDPFPAINTKTLLCLMNINGF